MNKTEYHYLLVAEECVEIAHRIFKSLRFGINEKQKGQELTNAERLKGELNDLMGAVRMLPDLDDEIWDNDLQVAKIKKIEKYMEYSRQCGTLTE